MRVLLLLALLVLTACALTVPTPTPARLGAPVIPTALPLTATTVPVPTLSPSTAAPTPTRPLVTIPDPNRGITFGHPASLVSGNTRIVGVMATNTSDLVKTFTVAATYRRDATILAVARGAVNDLMPGQQRAVVLIQSEPVPASAQTMSIGIDMVVEEMRTTTRAQAAQQVAFGPPHVSVDAGETRVEVDVSNRSSETRTMNIQAALLAGDALVGVGLGVANDLSPGATTTVGLPVQGTATGYDRVLIAVDAVLR